MPVSLADRAARAFMRFGLYIAVFMFVAVGSDVLLSQWITGYASATYIFGTAALLAGICVGLFALIAALGLAVAAALGQAAAISRREPAAPGEANLPRPQRRTRRPLTNLRAKRISRIS